MFAPSALRPAPPRRPGMPLDLRVRLAVARHRRAVIASLVGLAVVAGLQVLRPPAPATTRVSVAVRDLPAGHRLVAGDLAARAWPREAAPAGLLDRPQGRVLAAPLRRGEPVTDVRVAPTGSSPARGVAGGGGAAALGRLPAGAVAVVVRPTDPAATLVVSPGDRVQVLAGAALDQVGGADAPPRVVVRDALVLTAPGRTAGAENPPASAGGGLLGALEPEDSTADRTGADEGGAPAGVLVLAVRPGDALELAAVTGIRALTVARQYSMSS